MRATIEQALRNAAATAEDEAEQRRDRQLAYLSGLAVHAEPDIMRSDEMWR